MGLENWVNAEGRIHAWASAQTDRSLLCALWIVAKDIQADSVDSDQTGRMLQVDLSLRFGHRTVCWICRVLSHYLFFFLLHTLQMNFRRVLEGVDHSLSWWKQPGFQKETLFFDRRPLPCHILTPEIEHVHSIGKRDFISVLSTIVGFLQISLFLPPLLMLNTMGRQYIPSWSSMLVDVHNVKVEAWFASKEPGRGSTSSSLL